MISTSNVVILDTAWGAGTRWFRINPRNYTGRHLYSAFGNISFVVTNACPEVVGSADEHGKPDADYLRTTLSMLQPKFVLVCGAVAQRTFQDDMISKSCAMMKSMHPAARSWTREMRAAWREQILQIVSK